MVIQYIEGEKVKILFLKDALNVIVDLLFITTRIFFFDIELILILSGTSLRYLFKYINTGSNRVTATINYHSQDGKL